MIYEVVRGRGVDLDLELIFEVLVEAAEGFGDDTRAAFERAERRFGEIEGAMHGLGHAPHQGTLHTHLGAGIRSVTKGRAIFYFDIEEVQGRVRILAVFFGGPDHEARILLRLLEGH